MIRFGSFSDKKDLQKLWQSTFLEDEIVTEDFFDNVFDSVVTPVYCVDEKIVASLFLLPCKIGKYEGKCVYCAQTAFAHRGKGYMRNLLEFSYDYIKENGFDFLVLVPAEKSLFDYYAKLGFENFGIQRVFENNGDIPETKPFEYTCELKFNEKIVDYWKNACVYYGGTVESFGLVFDDEKIIIRNAMGNFESFKKYENAFIQGKINFGETTSPAMIRTDNDNIKKMSCYVGITLE
jgi:GNAT superfamily N-acetyltransferase